MIIHHQSFVASGFCNRGLRKLAKDNGIDWTDFINNGIDSEILLSFGDSRAEQVIQMEINRIGGNSNG